MAFALKLSFVVVILACAGYVQSDVSHLGYSRYTGPRVQPLRLQRLESSPTPYPASGYRPNREFNLPNERPLFPLGNQQGNRPFVSSGSDVLSEPIRPQRPLQRPELVYGAPEPRFPQQSRPQSSNAFNGFAAQPQQPEFVEQSSFNNFPENQNNFNSGFNNLAEPQQPQNNQNNFNSGFNNLAEPQQPQNNFNSGFNNLAQPQQPQGNQNNDFNNFAEPQQRPELTYGAPNTQEQSQSGSDELSEPQQPQQRPQYNYNAPSAKLRQLLVARLQQAQRLEQAQRQQQQQADNQAYRYTQGQAQSQAQSQRQQQLTNSPQTLYSAPPQRQQQQSQVQTQSQAETSGRLTQKPARLTDNREEREEEDAKTSETVVDIETTTKTETQKSANQVAATTPALAATGLYYPAAAFSYVQPFSAAYVQPVSAAYTVGSTFLPQQYALATAAAPAQLQAW